MPVTTRSGRLRRGRLPNYYEVLGVSSHSTLRVIEDAYWELAFSIHARGESRALRKRLARLNDAYQVLGTPWLRDEYDAIYGWREKQQEERGWLQRFRDWLDRIGTSAESAAR